jgi:pimeloyl-ACP methyl ester carboxylesterase
MTTGQLRRAARGYPAQASFSYRQVPGAVPVVMLHGLGGDSGQLAGLPWGPRSQEWTTLVPDLRGHGRSSATTAVQPTFDLLAHDVDALSGHLGLGGKVVLAGISMGAGVALRLTLASPHRVAGLVCIRPAWEHHPYPPNLDVLQRIADGLETGDPDLGRARFASSDDFSALADRFPDAAHSLLSYFDTSQPQRMARMLRAMPASAPYSAPHDLQHVKCPTVIVGNKDDPMHPVDLAHRWSAAIPQARFIEAPPRYSSAAEHARAIVDVATGFVTSLDAPDPSLRLMESGHVHDPRQHSDHRVAPGLAGHHPHGERTHPVRRERRSPRPACRPRAHRRLSRAGAGRHPG